MKNYLTRLMVGLKNSVLFTGYYIGKAAISFVLFGVALWIVGMGCYFIGFLALWFFQFILLGMLCALMGYGVISLVQKAWTEQVASWNLKKDLQAWVRAAKVIAAQARAANKEEL